MPVVRFAAPLAPLAPLALPFLLAACTQAHPIRQPEDPATATRNLMAGVVHLHHSALQRELEQEPSSREAWEDLRAHARALNEASYTLQRAGDPSDEVWANAASRLLRRGSTGVLQAAERRDLPATRQAFDSMSAACGACHQECTPVPASFSG